MLLRKEKEDVFISYIGKEAEGELLKSISMKCPKTSVEKLHEFLFTDKRTRVTDTSLLRLLKSFITFKH